MRRIIGLWLLLVLSGFGMVVASAADEVQFTPFEFTGPCAATSVATPRTEACDAFITANPVPTFENAIEYDPQRDGDAVSRAIFLPDEPLDRPIAWMKRNWYYTETPGIMPNDQKEWKNLFVDRYNIFYLYNVVEVDGALWYLVDGGKWIKDEYLSILHVPAVPDGVTGRWMVIDLAQQVLIAMEDEKPVMATLISSGYWLDTTEGLFHIYARTLSMQMKGPPGADPPLYNFRTQWVMFFNEHQAVHSANFHNWFGLKRSHGCVNVVPGDIEWLWNYFENNVEVWHPSHPVFRVDFPELAPAVLVYNSPRLPEPMNW